MAKSADAPNLLQFEMELWNSGILLIAGVDEAGRGPLAGPVVAAAVIFERDWLEREVFASLQGLNDSKQLTEQKREQYFSILTGSKHVAYGIARVDSTEIDRINILQATHLAMNRAIAMLNPPPRHVLVDGRPVKSIRQPCTAIVKGDARSYSIAAASVLAKVTRDRLMLDYDKVHPGYGFAVHKGYGTPQHLAAIEKLGPCPIHRLSFAPMKQPDRDLFSGMPSPT